MNQRMAVIASTVPLVAAMALGPAPAAEAAERFSVVVVDDQSFTGEPGRFTSNIPGCPTGSSVTPRAMVQEMAGVFRGTRTFVCDSGLATFTVNLSARFGEGGSAGTWSLVASTGMLGVPHGAGKLVGVPRPEGIIDTYTGTVTITG